MISSSIPKWSRRSLSSLAVRSKAVSNKSLGPPVTTLFHNKLGHSTATSPNLPSIASTTTLRYFSASSQHQDDTDNNGNETDDSEMDFSSENFPSPPPIREPKMQRKTFVSVVQQDKHYREPSGNNNSKHDNNSQSSSLHSNNNPDKTSNTKVEEMDANSNGVIISASSSSSTTTSYQPPEPVKIPHELMERIEKQEWQGGRMRAAQHGVLHEDPKIDMRLLMENYSVASLASALRDREDVLQQCATLAEAQDFEELQKVLQSFHPRYVLQRRKKRRRLDVCRHLDAGSLEVIRKALMRMPRTVTTAHTQRAGVVIPLCIVNGVPSLLLEKRSPHLRSHPDEVCLPGGMVCSINDTTIISTCLREMQEEIPGLDMSIVQVLGILRCNWGEVHHLVGVAVTPVVCYLGEIPDNLHHNKDEVAKVFTIPLKKLLENSLWVQKEDLAPIFVGGPEIIWGLTGYILERFVKDIILPNHIRKDHHLHHHSLKTV